MPKRINQDAGLTKLPDGTYRTRLTHKGKNYEKTLRTRDLALKWRSQLSANLDRCPDGITYERGMWVARVEGPTSQLVERTAEFETAKNWLSKTLGEVENGTYKEDAVKNRTLKDQVKVWRSRKVRATARTLKRYDTSLNNQILPYLGEMRIAAISTSDVSNWVAKLVQDGHGASSVAKAVALLKQIMKAAHNDELIRRNPVVDIEIPTVVPKDQKALTLVELKNLTDACPDHRALLLVLGLMGLRISEATALQVKDVDVLGAKLSVQRSHTHGADYKRIVSTTKTKKKRVLDIPKPVLNALKPLVEGRKAKEFVFLGPKGLGAINYTWFRNTIFMPAIASFGLEDVGIHNLRHTAASLLISQGAQITTVSKILGHASIVQTLKTYGHYYPSDMQDSLFGLGAAFEELP
jgi:integrase